MKSVTNKIKLWTFDNFATSEECQKLLDLAESKGYRSSEVQNLKDTTVEPSTGSGGKKVLARNSTSSFVESAPICDTFILKAKKALKGLGYDPDKLFMEVEGLQVQRYQPGQKYNPHYDTFEDKDSDKQRWWTVMVYLGPDGILEGGDTYFPKIDQRVSPRKGRGVIWNNLNDDYCRDVNTLHMGTEVTKGTKHIVTIWFRKPPGQKYLCGTKESFRNPDFYPPQSESEPEWWIFLLLLVFLISVGYFVVNV